MEGKLPGEFKRLSELRCALLISHSQAFRASCKGYLLSEVKGGGFGLGGFTLTESCCGQALVGLFIRAVNSLKIN